MKLKKLTKLFENWLEINHPNQMTSHIQIYTDGSGSIWDEGWKNHLFEFDTLEELEYELRKYKDVRRIRGNSQAR